MVTTQVLAFETLYKQHDETLQTVIPHFGLEECGWVCDKEGVGREG